jgi:uncharacterized membrane protein
MPSKYDTNPLDPDFPERARAQAADSDGPETRVLEQGNAPTRHFPPPARTEEQTRRFGPPEPAPFAPPFNGTFAPMGFVAPTQPVPVNRKVPGIPLPENVVTALPYIPWYIGLIAGALILLLVPRSETKVRFHAAQGLAAHVGILIVTTVLGILGNITGVAEVGNIIFQIVTTIMLVIFAIKAWRGRPVHIETVDDLTNWLDHKIDPKLASK